jgi:hypothetical protein
VEEEVKKMKKLMVVAVVLTVVVFAFGAMAQQKGAPAKPAPAGETWNAAIGSLDKIDAAAKTLDVKTMVKAPKSPVVEKMMTFATDGNTKIFMLGEKNQPKKLSFDYLKVGMTLWLTYKIEGGKNIALSIEVRPK